jgi:nucleoside-diphosphate-sugar epimerase
VAEKTYDAPTATTEDQPVTLYHDSPYSISKIIGELYGNYYFQQHKLPFVKARFSNVFGPREILGAGQWRGTVHTVWRNVTPTFIWRSLNGEALPLDNGGNASRDFIFVEDMARGLMACALKGAAGGVYNLATGRETSILELATIINEYTGNTTPLDLRPARDWDRSGKRFASTEKAARELGFTRAGRHSRRTAPHRRMDQGQPGTDQAQHCQARQADGAGEAPEGCEMSSGTAFSSIGGAGFIGSHVVDQLLAGGALRMCASTTTSPGAPETTCRRRWRIERCGNLRGRGAISCISGHASARPWRAWTAPSTWRHSGCCSATTTRARRSR